MWFRGRSQHVWPQAVMYMPFSSKGQPHPWHAGVKSLMAAMVEKLVRSGDENLCGSSRGRSRFSSDLGALLARARNSEI